MLGDRTPSRVVTLAAGTCPPVPFLSTRPDAPMAARMVARVSIGSDGGTFPPLACKAEAERGIAVSRNPDPGIGNLPLTAT